MNPRVEKLLKLPLYQRILILAGLVAIVVALFVYSLYLPKQEELRNLQKKSASLESKLQEDRRIANNLPKFKAEFEKMSEQLQAALTQLPNQKEIPSLLSSIASLANDQGLEVLRFKPGKEVSRGFYADVPVELKLVGSFHQVASFFYEVGQLPRIVNIGNVKLSAGKGNLLSVDCMATTFRFVDQPAAQSDKKKRKR
ncbi:type 4a pilus biogenesis protein PilO [Desulfuromonas sp. AOP6]|uniref:type 4a pilus biogenesis protein PilO n=1 Tax=Desulfuromonas sp. AOP6 TaxID=1566351 RepID=UPI0012888E50|nr:type 4a pilus biogenesis protein PilO [Desulfuromonas sp. AOP6]BCA80199.1 pilus assembly protein PilO [Desulfuromonas sp. AOP6]